MFTYVSIEKGSAESSGMQNAYCGGATLSAQSVCKRDGSLDAALCKVRRSGVMILEQWRTMPPLNTLLCAWIILRWLFWESAGQEFWKQSRRHCLMREFYIIKETYFLHIPFYQEDKGGCESGDTPAMQKAVPSVHISTFLWPTFICLGTSP